MEVNRSKVSWGMGGRGSVGCGRRSGGQGGGAESIREGKGEGKRREGREGKEGAEMAREGQRGVGRGKGCDHVDV